jgi:hypothetical protein
VAGDDAQASSLFDTRKPLENLKLTCLDAYYQGFFSADFKKAVFSHPLQI